MSFLSKLFPGKTKKRKDEAQTTESVAETVTEAVATGADEPEKTVIEEPAKGKKAKKIKPEKVKSEKKPKTGGGSGKGKLLLPVFLIMLLAGAAVYVFFGDDIMDIVSPPPPPKRTIAPKKDVSTSNLPDIPAVNTQPAPVPQNPSIDSSEIIQEFSVMKPHKFEPVDAPIKTVSADTKKVQTKAPVKASKASAKTAKASVAKASKAPKVKVATTTKSKPKPKPKPKPTKTAAKPTKVQSKTQTAKKPVQNMQVPARLAKKHPEEPYITKANASFYVNEFLMKADAAYSQGNFQDALDYYEVAYKYSKKPDIEFNLILLHIQLKHFDEAKSMMTSSWLPDTELRELLQEMSNQGNRDKAYEIAKSILPKDKTGQLYYFIGYLDENAGKTTEALPSYRRAMIKSDYNPYFTFAYARAQDNLKNYEEALTYYRIVAGNSEDAQLRNYAAKRIDDIFSRK